MIDTTALLEELISAGTPARLVAQVASLVAEAQSLRQRRAADAGRKRMSRDKTDVTGCHVTMRMSRDTPNSLTETIEETTSGHVTSDMSRDPPPAYTTPPKKIKPKRVLSARQTLPADFALTESDNRYALDRGWTLAKIVEELDRFRNNATAKGVKYADWHAAWRNWVTSPFQAPKANGASPNGPPSKPSVSDVLARLCDETSPDLDGVFPQVGRQ